MRRIRIVFSDILFVFIITVLALISVLSYQRLMRFNAAYAWVNHSDQVKLKLVQTLSYLKDSETGARGFLLTRDSTLLIPYSGSEEKANKIISSLDSLLQDDQEQLVNLQALRELVKAKFIRLDDILTNRNKSPAILHPQLLEENQLMIQCREIIIKMNRNENKLLLERTENKDRYATITPLLSLIFSIIAIIIVILAYFRLRSETHLRFRAEDSEAEIIAAGKKIEETEQRLRLAIEAAALGTFDWNFTDRIFLSSTRLTEIFGFQGRLNVTHEDLISTFHPDDRPIREKAVADSYTTGSLSYEIRIIWPDGSIHWINVYGKVIYNENRQPARMYGTVIDVSTPKSRLEELRKSEIRFRLLANSMPQKIWTGDEKGQLNYFNDAVYSFSGFNKEEIFRKGWINIVHPDDREANIKKWRHAIETGEEFFLEHRFRDSHGEYRWQLSRALPQKDENGKIQMWVGTSTDIQDQKNFMQELEEKVKERTQSLIEANDQLENTIIELEQSNAELESFNYVASHDLQEPLRKIIAFSQRISDKDKSSLSDTSKDYFSRITRAATRMQSLIDAFLSYSQTGNAAVNYEDSDLNLMLEEVKNDLREVIEEKKARIYASQLPIVPVIPLQFHQLLVNLMSNALKYSKPDLSPVISLSAHMVSGVEISDGENDPAAKYWNISLTDNGIGFEQQYGNKIFELFQRLHGKTDYTGTGIGLAICKKIMRNHKGFITATGELGIGAVFSIFIPLTQSSNKPEIKAPADDQIQKDFIGGG